MFHLIASIFFIMISSYISSCSQFRVQRSTLYKLQDGLLALNCPCDCYFLVIIVLLNIYDTGMFSAQMGTKANE